MKWFYVISLTVVAGLVACPMFYLPGPQTDAYAAVAHTGMNPFGVNTFLQLEVEPTKRERQMLMIREAGFSWIRQEFTWEDIEVHGKGDFEAASSAFDLVLEKYPENSKTPDAMFMKAQSLVQQTQKRSAAREFRALVKKYPDTGLAQRAQDELAKLGF